MKPMASFVVACLIGLSIAGCGDKNKLRPLPLTRALDLTSHKVGKVDMVVKDKDRAEQVKAVLFEIEILLLSRRKVQNAMRAKAYADIGDTAEASSAAIKEAFATLQADREKLYEKYIDLQLELRQHLTEGEFNKLDAVR